MSNMELIKKLRDTTGSGIVDCKKALQENNNDLEASIKWLREKGILKAQKKQDRETNEGVVSLFNHDSSFSSFALCKIKCETDFVAKNDDFLNFAHSLTKSIFENNEIEKIGTSENLSKILIGDKDLNTALTDLISKIGENIQIVSYKKYNADNSIFVSYLHNKYNSSCSKIASIVEISTNDISKKVDLIAKLKVVAMKGSAMKPMSLEEKSLDKKIVDEERDIILNQNEKTKEDQKEMIVKGKQEKYIKEETSKGER